MDYNIFDLKYKNDTIRLIEELQRSFNIHIKINYFGLKSLIAPLTIAEHSRYLRYVPEIISSIYLLQQFGIPIKLSIPTLNSKVKYELILNIMKDMDIVSYNYRNKFIKFLLKGKTKEFIRRFIKINTHYPYENSSFLLSLYAYINITENNLSEKEALFGISNPTYRKYKKIIMNTKV